MRGNKNGSRGGFRGRGSSRGRGIRATNVNPLAQDISQEEEEDIILAEEENYEPLNESMETEDVCATNMQP